MYSLELLPEDEGVCETVTAVYLLDKLSSWYSIVPNNIVTRSRYNYHIFLDITQK